MDTLFELIFSNIFIIFLLIWFLSGLFGKKGRGQQREQPRAPRPTAGPFEFPWEKVEEESPQRRPAQAQREEPHRQPREFTELEGRTQDARGENVESRQPDLVFAQGHAKDQDLHEQRDETHINERRRDLNLGQSVRAAEIGDMFENSEELRLEVVQYSRKAKTLLDFKRMDQTNVTQGIIWSQIFSPPRAKDPHRTNDRAHKTRRYSNTKY